MKKLLFYSLFIFLCVDCSSRDEDSNDGSTAVILPKTLKSINSLGETTSDYQYDGNKLKAIKVNNILRSAFTYTSNLITKVVSYDSSGAITSEFNYEYKNNKLSKTHYKIGQMSTNIFYTWIDDNHVSIEDDKYKPLNAIDKTEIYFNNGNVIKSTNYTHYPNYYTINKVEVIENDDKNNPFKNIEGYSLISFDISSDFFPQTNNIKKITSKIVGTVNGEPLAENYSRNFQQTYNDKNFPQAQTVTNSYGNTYNYEFSYFKN